MNKPIEEILTLIRAEALEQAEKHFRLLSCSAAPEDEDHLALKGRILKAKALEAPAGLKQNLFLKAARAYHHAFSATGGSYSGINAASLYRLADEKAQSLALANEVLTLCGESPPQGKSDRYYHHATRAEAYALSGKKSAALEQLGIATMLDKSLKDEIASTLNQFSLLLPVLGWEPADLDPFRLPAALHYVGRMWEANQPSLHEEDLKLQIDHLITEQNIGYAFGALAAGSDILVAEALLNRNVVLHIILPSTIKAFKMASVTPFGPSWEARFDAILRRCDEPSIGTTNTDTLDLLDIELANQIAMGRAQLYAHRYAAKAHQLLILSQHQDSSGAITLTAGDVWRSTGAEQHSLPCAALPISHPAPSLGRASGRKLYAMIFADVAGFGQLSEGQIPIFIKQVLPVLAAAFQQFKPAPDIVNSWGDGIFLAYQSVEAAAKTAFAMRTAFENLSMDDLGLPNGLSLRVAAHYAPALPCQDILTGAPNIYGAEVIFAARIEPQTPPGSIYVSEAFAAQLSLSKGHAMVCEPVGELEVRATLPRVSVFSLRQQFH